VSDALYIVAPPAGAKLPKGEPQTMGLSQQVHVPPFPPQGMAMLQFSNSENGPWTLAAELGEGGPVESERTPWDGRDQTWSMQFAMNKPRWVRAAVWEDSFGEPPFLVAENPRFYGTVEQAPAPEGGPPRG
jgi:hypothetical protein